MNKKNNEQNKVKYGFYYYSCNLMVVSELLKAILAGFLGRHLASVPPVVAGFIL